MDQFTISQTKPDPAPQENNLPQQIPTTTPPADQPPPNPPESEPPRSEAQATTYNESAGNPAKPGGSFRAVFLILLLLTMASAAATTYIIMNWNRPTETASQAQTPVSAPTLEEIGAAEVEANPFSDAALDNNPFEQSPSNSTNIFNEFEESTQSGEEFQNPF